MSFGEEVKRVRPVGMCRIVDVDFAFIQKQSDKIEEVLVVWIIAAHVEQTVPSVLVRQLTIDTPTNHQTDDVYYIFVCVVAAEEEQRVPSVRLDDSV